MYYYGLIYSLCVAGVALTPVLILWMQEGQEAKDDNGDIKVEDAGDEA